MNKVEEINYLPNKLDKLFGYHYKNTGNLKLDIIKTIQNIVKEILKMNQYLIKIRNMCIFCKNNFNLIYNKNMLQRFINIDKEKLRIIIQYILLSKKLRDTFEINENINILEMNFLIKDIEESIFWLDFDKEDDISNYILAYIKKFVKVN